MIGPKLAMPTAREEREAYELVTLRDADTCQRCRRSCGPIARDHRRNRSQGGWTVVGNLQCLGLECHTWKTEHPAEANDEGWGCPSWVHWREWPARRWVSDADGGLVLAWVLYDDEGSWAVISDEDARYRIEGGVPF
jgi:hypothetical protein